MNEAEETRPWGSYRVLLDGDDCKVKEITVLPGARLSYQRHSRRAEHWYLLAGEGVVTLEGKDRLLRPGEAIDIPCGAAHRMANPETALLRFIEVQTGDYFGEDDIVRIEDDYSRL